MVAHTKRQVIDYIHRLLLIRIKRTGIIQWKCVIRDGHVQLVAPYSVQPTDFVIVDYDTFQDFLPLRTMIHQGVDENWDNLNRINITL